MPSIVFSMVDVMEAREGMTAFVRGVVSKRSRSAVNCSLVMKFSKDEYGEELLSFV